MPAPGEVGVGRVGVRGVWSEGLGSGGIGVRKVGVAEGWIWGVGVRESWGPGWDG